MQKKLITALLITIVAMSTQTSAFAINNTNGLDKSSNVITAAQYEAGMQSEFAKYNMGFELVDYKSDFVFTTDLLDADTKTFRTSMESSNYDKSVGAFVQDYGVVTLNTNLSEYSIENPARVMPYKRSFSETKKISQSTVAPFIAWANIQVNVTATEDAQSEVFLSVDSVTSRQYGGALNFVSWTQNSHTFSIVGASKRCISGHVSGTLVSGYTSPAGISVTYSSDQNISMDCWL